MGYPMTYRRVVNRNGLQGGYGHDGVPDEPGLRTRRENNPGLSAICGDLRRLEEDQRDEAHLARYAELCGVTPEQAKAVLDVFFKGDW